MAVDIQEYRKQRIEEQEKAEKAAVPLVEQSAVPASTETGNETLDKLLRALQPVVDLIEKNVIDSALSAMKAPDELILRTIQFQHLYMLGKRDAFKEVADVAQKVALETKQNSQIVIPF